MPKDSRCYCVSAAPTTQLGAPPSADSPVISLVATSSACTSSSALTAPSSCSTLPISTAPCAPPSRGASRTRGQICIRVNRILVDYRVHDVFVDRFGEGAVARRQPAGLRLWSHGLSDPPALTCRWSATRNDLVNALIETPRPPHAVQSSATGSSSTHIAHSQIDHHIDEHALLPRHPPSPLPRRPRVVRPQGHRRLRRVQAPRQHRRSPTPISSLDREGLSLLRRRRHHRSRAPRPLARSTRSRPSSPSSRASSAPPPRPAHFWAQDFSEA